MILKKEIVSRLAELKYHQLTVGLNILILLFSHSLFARTLIGGSTDSQESGEKELMDEKFFVADAIGGTLARDHQSRAIYFEGKHKKTYVAYMDDDFYARVTCYDHSTGEWLRFPVLVDHCIAPGGPKDGHNAPNIFVTSDGTVHLFYGSHGSRGHRFKYARSTKREDISHWETGLRIGNYATYP